MTIALVIAIIMIIASIIWGLIRFFIWFDQRFTKWWDKKENSIYDWSLMVLKNEDPSALKEIVEFRRELENKNVEELLDFRAYFKNSEAKVNDFGPLSTLTSILILIISTLITAYIKLNQDFVRTLEERGNFMYPVIIIGFFIVALSFTFLTKKHMLQKGHTAAILELIDQRLDELSSSKSENRYLESVPGLPELATNNHIIVEKGSKDY